MNPTDIQGWMTEVELAWLVAHARDAHNIVEIGSWRGRSTVALAAATPGHVWAVDTWAGAPGDDNTNERWYPDVGTAYDEFIANTRNLPVSAIRMSSHAARAVLGRTYGPVFDMIFIDGDHRYSAVHYDIMVWRELLRPGGLLCGHDYSHHCPGVVSAVNELMPPTTIIGPDSIWSARL